MRSLNRRILWVLVGLCLLVSCAMAQVKQFDDSVLTETGKQAYQSVLKVKVFAIGGVGYGGETSKGELALDVLIEEKHALDAFKRLIVDGTAEGAMYGLFGLRMLGCKCYDEEFTRLKSIHFSEGNRQTFTTQSGCILMPAETYEDKDLVFNEMMKEWFSIKARLKECKRQAKGQPTDFSECYKGDNK